MKNTLTPCEVINIVQSMNMTETNVNKISAQSMSLFVVSIALENKAKKEENKTLLMLSLLYKLIAKRLIAAI